MKKIYFGAWQNFYHLSWSIRFFIEITVSLFLIFMLCKLVRKSGVAFRLKPYLIKGCVWISTEVIYLLGRNNSWAVEIDNKIIEWGDKKLNGGAERKKVKTHKALKFWVISGTVIIYFLAVFVDMPVADHLQKEYFVEFENIKKFFQKYEETLSRGYEDYPPLFVKKEPEQTAEEPAEAAEEKEEIPVYIQLNETGKNGANVRQEPSLDGEIIGGVNAGTEIFYRYQWDCDEEGRYWIKIYVPSEEVEGWLSGKLVESTQLESLINGPER